MSRWTDSRQTFVTVRSKCPEDIQLTQDARPPFDKNMLAHEAGCHRVNIHALDILIIFA